jgi:hypothetical protein
MADKSENTDENRVNCNSGPSRSVHTQMSRMTVRIEDTMRAMIAEEIVKALGNFKSQSSGSRKTSPSVHKGESSQTVTNIIKRRRPTGCSYKTFTSCKPVDFYGKKGAIEACEWVSQTEAVLDITNYVDEDKVRLVVHLF